MNEACRLQPSRGRAWRPFRGFLGGGAVAASLGLHGAGAALAVLAWPPAPATVRGPAAPASAVELELDGGLDPEEAPAKGAPLSTAPRPATPRHRLTISPLRLLPRNPARDPSSTPATPASVLATVAPPLSSDTTRPAFGPALSQAVVRRFALSAGNVASQASGPGVATTTAATPGASRAETAVALAEEEIDTPAKVLTRAPAVYPEAARRAAIETDVPLMLTVALDGHVSSATALAHPGYGLEEAAVRAAAAYLFRPAERGGRAVAVRMRWVIQFRLR